MHVTYALVYEGSKMTVALADIRTVLGDRTNTPPTNSLDDKKQKGSFKRKAKLDPSQRPLKFARLQQSNAENVDPNGPVLQLKETKDVEMFSEPSQSSCSRQPTFSCSKLLRQAASSSRVITRRSQNSESRKFTLFSSDSKALYSELDTSLFAIFRFVPNT